MDKHTQLIKFGTVLKQRRLALKLSLRELEKLSSVSAALITKLENGKMANFPKAITYSFSDTFEIGFCYS